MIMSDMFQKLKQLLTNSYSPYSNFKVSAIVDTDIGEFAGVNIENSSFGATICAERNAIFNAISNGAKNFNKLSILTSSTEDNIVPCASCLQVMSEFFKPDTKIEVFNINGKSKEYSFKQLLPVAFNKTSLEK